MTTVTANGTMMVALLSTMEKWYVQMVMGEGHNDDNDATEMTTVIMINTIVTDHDDDDDDVDVGEGVIHDSDGGAGGDGQRMAVLIMTKVTRERNMLCTCFPQ